MRPQGLVGELLMASSEARSAALAASLSPEQVALLLEDFSVIKGELHLLGRPLKASWRLSGVLSLMRAWPGLGQIERIALRAEPEWAPDFGVLAAMPSLVELRLSLSRHPIPPLPASLRSLRLDLPGTLELAHPALERLHLYGGAQSGLPDWSLLPLLEELSVERMGRLLVIASLPARLRRLELTDLPELCAIPELGPQVALKTVRCPKIP